MKWVCAALLALVACHRSSAPAELRIVSLSPSTTEATFAVGAGSRMVGRSRYCNYPAEVLKLPQVGGYVDPSFEAILGLRPSLVVGARGPAGSAIAEKLEAHGIKTYFPPTETFAQIDEMIFGSARAPGTTPTRRRRSTACTRASTRSRRAPPTSRAGASCWLGLRRSPWPVRAASRNDV
ncbi:MAG: helical backbone metal receptor [Labilithrix sp.]